MSITPEPCKTMTHPSMLPPRRDVFHLTASGELSNASSAALPSMPFMAKECSDHCSDGGVTQEKPTMLKHPGLPEATAQELRPPISHHNPTDVARSHQHASELSCFGNQKVPLPSPFSNSMKSQQQQQQQRHNTSQPASSVAVPLLLPATNFLRALSESKAKAAAAAAASLKKNNLPEPLPRGVTFRPSGKWQVQLYYAGHSRYIGLFATKQQAAAAYEGARDCCGSFTEKVNPITPDEINQNIEVMRKAAVSFAGGACAHKHTREPSEKKRAFSSLSEVKQTASNKQKAMHLSSGLIEECKKRQRISSSGPKPAARGLSQSQISVCKKRRSSSSKCKSTRPKAIHSSSSSIQQNPATSLIGTSSDEGKNEHTRISNGFNKLGKDRKHILPGSNSSKIGRRCPCICSNVDCAAITKARKAMGLEDGRVELPSMDLLKKHDLGSKEKLDASILTSAIDALGLNAKGITTKKNRIQCDHYSLEVRHRLRRSRGVIYVACKFFTSEGKLVIPTQTIGDRVAELNMLQVIHSKAPTSFVSIKNGLIGKGDLIVTKEMLWTMYVGLVHPEDKAISTTHGHNRRANDLNEHEHETARVSPDLCSAEEENGLNRADAENCAIPGADPTINAEHKNSMHVLAVNISPELSSRQETNGFMQSLDSSDILGPATATYDKLGDKHQNATMEAGPAHWKRSNNFGSCTVVGAVKSCLAGSGLEFLIRACEAREGNF